MYHYRYRISLRIKHPSEDLEKFSEILALSPSRVWKSGEPRQTPKGKLLEGVYKNSYWTAKLHEENHINSEDTFIEDYLESLNQRLNGHKELFNEFISSGGHIEYLVGWFSDGQNIAMELSPELLKSTADLNIAITLDVYAYEESETASKSDK